MRVPAVLVIAAAAALMALARATAGAGEGVTLEAGCTPDAARPLEVTLFTCDATITNPGSGPIEGARIQTLPPSQLRMAFPYWFDQRLDGQLLPNQPNGIDAALGFIEPAQTRTFTMRFFATLDGAGDYGFDLQVSVPGGGGATRTVRFSGDPTATAPPRDVTIEPALLDEALTLLPPLDGLPAPLANAHYEIRTVSRSSAPISHVSIEMRFMGDV